MASIDEIVNRQVGQWLLQRQQQSPESAESPDIAQIVTVSRQIGSRGSYLAREIAEELGYQLLDRQVIDAIVENSGYRRQIVESLDERFRGDLELLVEALLTGQSVDHSDYNRHLYEVVLSMGRLGGVVLVGRGGAFVLGPLRGFHIRVVAPVERRVANLCKQCGCSADEAAIRVAQSDLERSDLIQRLFGARIDEPSNYDLVLNSGAVTPEVAVTPLVTMIRAKLARSEVPTPG